MGFVRCFVEEGCVRDRLLPEPGEQTPDSRSRDRVQPSGLSRKSFPGAALYPRSRFRARCSWGTADGITDQ